MARKGRNTGWRVFFGIELPPWLRNRLAIEQHRLRLPHHVDPEDLHLTLVFLGETPPDLLEASHEAADALAMPGFTLAPQGMGLFGKSRPRNLWAGLAPCPPLLALQSKLETALHRVGAAPEKRRFLPHITLGRFPPTHPPESTRLETLVAGAGDFSTDPFPVQEFVLFRSQPQGTAPHYTPLARYGLL
ncbi:MAG: RNA 2',3'-cyclic phosphodiesterase [Pseudorhodobacter sp.]